MGTNMPLPVSRAMTRLGHNLSLIRRRRNMSQDMLAERIDASVNTVRRMEEGSPGIALQHFVRALQVFGELEKLNQLFDTSQDYVGLVLMDEKLPQRVRKPKKTPDSGSF